MAVALVGLLHPAAPVRAHHAVAAEFDMNKPYRERTHQGLGNELKIYVGMLSRIAIEFNCDYYRWH